MTPQTQSDDRAARNRIRESLDESLIVEASAGTGKTSELVRRIVRVLQTGLTSIDKIVAVTFTNKAAGELKLRLRQGLDVARAQASGAAEVRHIEDALEHLEEAAIGTIHAFCALILRERPVEAVVDPAFRELSQPEAERLYHRAFRGWIQQKLGESAPALRRAFARMSWQDPLRNDPPMEQLEQTGRKLVEWRDFPAPWRTGPFDRTGGIDALVERVRELEALCARSRRTRDTLLTALGPLRELAAWIERAEQSRGRDYDTLEGRMLRLLRDLSRDHRTGAGTFADGVARKDVLARRDALLAALEDFRRHADADLAAGLRAEMLGLVERYQTLKRQSGSLDFVDLLILVRNLVRGNAEVRRYLQERFTHIFVDEFQDTDPLQVEILLLLAAADPDQTDWQKAAPAPGKLFVVGDPKQSIYKFRRADVQLYQQVRESLRERGVGLVRLTKSFRALRPIQECVNAAFAPEMTGSVEAGQAEYVPLEQHHQPATAQPCIVALPAPYPYASHKLAKTAMNACLPDTIAAMVEWLVESSGWQVRDAENAEKLVPLTPRHICLLFRRFLNWGQDLTRDYVRSFEARGIPHLLVGSKSFHRREEVEALRAALNAVEWPEDELALFAALKGSLFAIPDSTLLRYRHEHKPLHPFRLPPEPVPEEFQPVCRALRLLADLHRGRNRRPVADTINELLEATRAHAGFALRPAGHQVLANVYRICDLARSFETGGGISFRGFVEELAAQANRQESAEAPVLEEGAEGVRLMTVHTAKGLEFPVVILADMTANLAAQEPDRFVDAARGLCATRLLRCAPYELLECEGEEKVRELSEGVRVAYVAATRARDLLIVPVCGDEERDGWISPLNKAVYPERKDYRESRPAPACCPAFGDASVLERPGDFVGHAEFSVKPGLHRARAGGHDVLWWDPATLKLAVGANFGLRQEDILADAGPDDGLERYHAWQQAREQAIAQGERMEYDVLTPSTAAGAPPAACEVSIEMLPSPADRPAGPRFGTLVHLVLRDLDLARAGAEAQALARMHGRVLGATAEETEAAAAAATAAAQHPLAARAGRAERLHRELPVMLRLEENRLLEGVIDLAFVENGVWHVVDFKSSADLKSHRAEYERQLQWYGAALSRITGLPVRGWVLGV